MLYSYTQYAIEEVEIVVRYTRFHVPSMLAKGIETINKQAATMAS